jgi:hypothetical protein
VIQDTLSRNSNPSITSDRWHVVHARWSGNKSGEPRFERSIVSEHSDRPAAVAAARTLQNSLAEELAGRPRTRRDQVFVRQPTYKSLKIAGLHARRRK